MHILYTVRKNQRKLQISVDNLEWKSYRYRWLFNDIWLSLLPINKYSIHWNLNYLRIFFYPWKVCVCLWEMRPVGIPLYSHCGHPFIKWVHSILSATGPMHGSYLLVYFRIFTNLANIVFCKKIQILLLFVPVLVLSKYCRVAAKIFVLVI